jgi:hypothetical protein
MDFGLRISDCGQGFRLRQGSGETSRRDKSQETGMAAKGQNGF